MTPAETTLRNCEHLINQRKLRQAEALLEPLMEALPDHIGVRILMGQLRLAQYRLTEAADQFSKAISLGPESPALHRELAKCYLYGGDLDQAIEQYQQAVALRPQLPESHHSIGDMLRRQGQLDAAEKQFRKTISERPTYTLTYAALADLVKFSADDPLFETITSLLNRDTVPAGDKQHLHFALGKMNDDIGNFDAAFDHYQLGNRLANRRFSTSKNHRLINTIIDYQEYPGTDVVTADVATGSGQAVPIFVLGMPRSGSTLVEQILASHPQISAAGETPFIKNILDLASETIDAGEEYPHLLRHLYGASRKELAAEYLRRLALAARAPADAIRLVDKMPVNFLYIGVIIALFPQARIIHTRRHPLDVCLSCYFHNFSTGLNYTFDLENLGRVFQDYQRLMGHWQALYPDNILDLEYETLVTNQEEKSRELLEFVGLDWDPACLNFYDTQRPLGTASLAQVRKPVYQSATYRWKNYASQLQPLAEILGIDIGADIARQNSQRQAETNR